MKYRENERGGALLMVLMLVVVFTILGMGLMSMNMSASKQFDKKEEQVQARHQAEMGLLHYKSNIKEEVIKYSFVKGRNETKEKALERSRNEICGLISGIEPPSNIKNGRKYVTKKKGICGESTDGRVFLELTSEGTSNKTSKIITGTASITPPNIIDEAEEGIIPGKPELPGGENPQPEFPDNYSAVDVVVNGPVKTKKETQLFGGSLVINKAPNNQKTFEVGGGNVYNLTVAKDFYIGGDFHSQNHSCIIVKGDLTILGKSYLGNKSLIIVYGNAYFEVEPDLQNDNSQIYVAGNTFLGKPPKKTQSYKNVASFSDCKKPDDFKNPYEPEKPSQYTYKWQLGDNLSPVYE